MLVVCRLTIYISICIQTVWHNTIFTSINFSIPGWPLFCYLSSWYRFPIQDQIDNPFFFYKSSVFHVNEWPCTDPRCMVFLKGHKFVNCLVYPSDQMFMLANITDKLSFVLIMRFLSILNLLNFPYRTLYQVRMHTECCILEDLVLLLIKIKITLLFRLLFWWL